MYLHDTKSKQLLAALAIDPKAVPHYTLQDVILRYKRRVWIGDNPSLQQQILEAFHAFVVGGHSIFPVTYKRMKQLFAWRGMKAITQDFVHS
jgi:hypothetical protein